MAAATDSSKSPEFPIHVVQPYPTILKPCWFKYFCSPLHQESLYLADKFFIMYRNKVVILYYISIYIKKYLWSKYFVTTPEPGARLVFTHGLTC